MVNRGQTILTISKMEKNNKTPKTKNVDPFTKSCLTPRSPKQHEEDILSSDSENKRENEEEMSTYIEAVKVNNALTNSRITINNIKTIITEGKGKISQKEKINNGLDQLFDIIAHLVAENNEMKGELKILRPLTNSFTQNIVEVKNIIQEHKSLLMNMTEKNEEFKNNSILINMNNINKDIKTHIPTQDTTHHGNKTAQIHWKEKKIRIFGEDAGHQIRRHLERNFKDVDCSSYIYPGATLDWYMANIIKESKNLTKNDFAILIAGENEMSPKNFLSNLYYILRQLAHTNVLIHPVPKNNYLNIYKLNSEIKSHISEFKKYCTFTGPVFYEKMNNHAIVKAMSSTRSHIKNEIHKISTYNVENQHPLEQNPKHNQTSISTQNKINPLDLENQPTLLENQPFFL